MIEAHYVDHAASTAVLASASIPGAGRGAVPMSPLDGLLKARGLIRDSEPVPVTEVVRLLRAALAGLPDDRHLPISMAISLVFGIEAATRAGEELQELIDRTEVDLLRAPLNDAMGGLDAQRASFTADCLARVDEAIDLCRSERGDLLDPH